MEILKILLIVFVIASLIAYISLSSHFYIISLNMDNCIKKKCGKELQLPTNTDNYLTLTMCMCNKCKSYYTNPTDIDACNCASSNCNGLAGNELSNCILQKCSSPTQQ